MYIHNFTQHFQQDLSAISHPYSKQCNLQLLFYLYQIFLQPSHHIQEHLHNMCLIPFVILYQILQLEPSHRRTISTFSPKSSNICIRLWEEIPEYIIVWLWITLYRHSIWSIWTYVSFARQLFKMSRTVKFTICSSMCAIYFAEIYREKGHRERRLQKNPRESSNWSVLNLIWFCVSLSSGFLFKPWSTYFIILYSCFLVHTDHHQYSIKKGSTNDDYRTKRWRGTSLVLVTMVPSISEV